MILSPVFALPTFARFSSPLLAAGNRRIDYFKQTRSALAGRLDTFTTVRARFDALAQRITALISSEALATGTGRIVRLSQSGFFTATAVAGTPLQTATVQVGRLAQADTLTSRELDAAGSDLAQALRRNERFGQCGHTGCGHRGP